MSVQAFLESFPSIVNSPWPNQKNIEIIRGDLLHPVVSGNKLYKLLPYIDDINCGKTKTIISVGGRYSNHLHALAWLGNNFGIKTVGIVSGYAEQEETPTLIDCKAWGMDIYFVDRAVFQRRYTKEFWLPWQEQYANSIVLYEGGWSKESISTSKLWWDSISTDTELVVCPVGSGTTLAGLALHAAASQKVIGVPVFKDPDNYESLKKKLLGANVEPESFDLWTNYAGKGFGKLSQNEKEFGIKFHQETGILLDPVYTVKVFYGLSQQLILDPTLSQKKIAIVHTGGLQGLRS